MNVLEAIERRASARVYDSSSLTGEELSTLINAASRAPSSGNLQHYSVIQVTSQEVKDKLWEVCLKQPFIKAAPLVMIFNADENRIKKWTEVYGGHFHFDGPCLFGKGFSDALIAAENVVLAAEGLGLGSVYIGTVINRAQTVRALLNYPKYVVPVAMLCIGRPKQRPPIRERLPLRAILHRDGYQDYTEQEIREIYAEAERNWASENPNGFISKDGIEIKSYAQHRTLAHYTEAAMRQGDKEFREAIKDAGFIGFPCDRCE